MTKHPKMLLSLAYIFITHFYFFQFVYTKKLLGENVNLLDPATDDGGALFNAEQPELEIAKGRLLQEEEDDA